MPSCPCFFRLSQLQRTLLDLSSRIFSWPPLRRAAVLAGTLSVPLAAVTVVDRTPLSAPGLPPGPAVANASYLPLSSAKTSGIADLILLYQGGAHRLAWTLEQVAPFVSYEDPATTQPAWLFDGFLFIEFKDGRGHEFARGYKQKAARREDWLWLLERNFERGHAIDALDQAIAQAAVRLGAPARRRQVVLTLPEPIFAQKDWGEVQGRPLDFARADDRVAACAWHIATALERWRALAPRHLDLAGFYWVAENAHQANEILPRIAEVIHRAERRFFWIPYWKAAGAADWRKLGFDAAYQQPNHFFTPKIADSRLDLACAFARTHGLGLEFECDGRAAQNAAEFRPRFEAYLRAFAQHGVEAEAAMAYYEGGGAWGSFARATDPAVRALYDRLARWVAARQQRADQLAAGPIPR